MSEQQGYYLIETGKGAWFNLDPVRGNDYRDALIQHLERTMGGKDFLILDETAERSQDVKEYPVWQVSERLHWWCKWHPGECPVTEEWPDAIVGKIILAVAVSSGE